MGYIRIIGGKFRLEDDNGNPAARGKVYTYTAGTSTAHVSYSNKECTVANTNPIILDERGECELYTNTALKLIATDLNDVVIWTEDYQGEQEEEYIISGNGVWQGDNRYTMDVVPPFTSIPANITIVMNPDVTNVTTMTSESSVGVTGINDLTWQGPYIGTTSGSQFSVQIDGVGFQGTGLNDLVWTGDLPGSVHTVRISTAAATDKFQWRKDGGAWSAEISITGAVQALDSDVSITFGAVTGHTLGDLWNNKDTFQWKKDGGAWTTGVAIYPRIGVAQLLGAEGIGVIFASMTGHTLNDIWALTVTTPVRVNFCSLGYQIVQKNVAGTLKALDGGDIVANIPASLINSTVGSYILENPSLPVLSSLPRTIYRREVVSDATVMATDASNELAFIGTAAHTLTLLPCATTSGKLFDLVNASNYQWTIRTDPLYAGDRIITPESPGGVTSFVLGAGTRMSCRLESNGINYHIPFDAGFIHGFRLFTSSGNFVCPDGVYTVYVTGCASGGGGAGAATGAGGGGGAGQFTYKQSLTTVPGTTYVVTIAAAGTGGVGNNHGVQGGNLTLGALLTLTGGSSGVKETGTYGITVNPAISNMAVAIGLPGVGGRFGGGGAAGVSVSIDGFVNQMNGLTGSGYGAGGGGGAAASGTANGGAGAPGFLLVEW